MIGSKIIEIQRVDSTNVFASQVLASEEPAEGTVFWAHDQFAGRGQNDHKWESESGKNLTFTVLLKPDFLTADRQFMLNKVITLGVLDFVHAAITKPASGDSEVLSRNSLPVVSIKWPNDIYVGDQKIGGILIEHKIMGSVISTTIAGIGLNVNQTRFAPDIPNPVSIIHILRHEVVLKDALMAVCRSLDLRYLALKEIGVAGLDKAYNQHLFGFGQWRKYLRDSVLFEGRITGVDELGRLVIEDRAGQSMAFNHKEVECFFEL